MSGWEPQPLGGSETPLARGWEPWDAPEGGEPELPPTPEHCGGRASLSGSVMAADLSVVDSYVLDCGVCFLPLKPPIFLCDVGHAICSPCHEELKDAGSKCYACGGVPVAGGYRRCHAMDLLVEFIRGPCPNAPYGCAARLAYHERADHVAACRHAPCHCPGEGCGFAGPTAALVDHIANAHCWPCKHVHVHSCPSISMDLRAGFNFIILPDDDEDDKYYGLILLNVTRHPFCRTVSVIWIRPESKVAKEMEMEIKLSYSSWIRRRSVSYVQTIGFIVDCSDLSHGLPADFNGRSQLNVPDVSFPGGDGDAMETKVEVFLDLTPDHSYSYSDVEDDDPYCGREW